MSPPDDARGAVGAAIQKMAAARLGRGFLPLGALVVLGLGELLLVAPSRGVGAWVVAGGVASGAALLLYGNTAVLRALGKADSVRGRLGAAAGLVSYAFGLWVVIVPGLRGLAGSGSAGGLTLALTYAVLGAVHLRHVGRVGELLRLAGTMAVPAPGEEAFR